MDTGDRNRLHQYTKKARALALACVVCVLCAMLCLVPSALAVTDQGERGAEHGLGLANTGTPGTTDIHVSSDDIVSGVCGTCSWRITSTGELVIAPTDGVSGTLNSSAWGDYENGSAWRDLRYIGQITSAKIDAGVSAGSSTMYMFSGCSNLTSIDLSGLDTSNVTNMGDMFSDCSSLESIDLSGLDTSKVMNMYAMFYGCSSLESIDLSGLNTSEVTDMWGMFYGCSSLTFVNLYGLNTSKVEDMSNFFANCMLLSSLDLTGFGTSSVVDMSCAFAGCENLESVTLTGLDTSSAQNMSELFSGCKALKSINLSGLNTSNVTDMWGMFDGCKALESANLSGLNTSKVEDMSGMFSDCTLLSSLDISGLDTPSVTDMSFMFNECNALASIDLSDFNTSKVTDMNSMFAYCKALTSIDLSGFNTSKVTDMSYMFRNCNMLTSLDLSGLETPEVTNMSNMFSFCLALESINLSGLKTSSVTDMSNMFENCKVLTDVNLSGLDTSKVENMGDMFANCLALESIDLSGLNTSSVKEMDGMFACCSSLASANLSGLDTPSLQNMAGMFFECSSLKSVDLSSFDTSSVTSMYNMFKTCTSLASFKVGADFAFKDTSAVPVAGNDNEKWWSLAGGAWFTPEQIASSRANVADTYSLSNKPPQATLKRLAGEASPDTSAVISAETFTSKSDWIVLARSDDFADAMSATGLAGTLNAPIILTDRTSLSASAKKEIKRLGAKNCYIIGGKGAMPGNFEGELKALGLTKVERVFGSESWDTSVKCAAMIAQHKGNARHAAIVAMSSNFQDALSVSSFAYKYGVPIYLETSGAAGRALPAAAIKDIKALSGTIYVPGGTGAVPESSVEGVFGKGRVVRLSGNDGYDTSNQIAAYMVKNNLLSADTACIACGAQAAKGSDALSGAALAGKRGGVMLLVNSNTAMEAARLVTIEGKDSQGTPAFLSKYASSVTNAYILGGSYVVPKALEGKIRTILGI